MTQVAFYVKAGKETGYGHIVRCLALADELKERGCECIFYGNRLAVERANDKGYTAYFDKPVIKTVDKQLNGLAIAEEARKGKKASLVFWGDTELEVIGFEPQKCDVWIVDLEGGCPPALAAQLRKACKTLVILNGVGHPDGDPGRLLADLVFYQGVTQRPYELGWSGFEGDWFEGPKWLILRKEFQFQAGGWVHDSPRTRMVVAAGGSDPRDITRKVLAAFEGHSNIQLQAIIGPSNERDYFEYEYNTAIWYNPPDMACALAWADIALVSYGMTAFECLALGLPTIALSISSDHAASAELVQLRSYGALMHLGEVGNVTNEDIRQAVQKMLLTPLHYSAAARRFVDGKGAQRVADKIMEAL